MNAITIKTIIIDEDCESVPVGFVPVESEPVDDYGTNNTVNDDKCVV